MKAPRVSILLPNLNNRSFLDERLATIRRQTFTDWELVVCDSYSEDGAWELLQAAAAADPRIRLEQTPRDGIYPNWNRCLARARGDFLCIATSDDTMGDSFLAEMLAALEAHSDCEIAQCCLNAIDANGAIVPEWWRLTGAARFLGADYQQPHIRRAPYDGILHCGMHTVYHSITQLLIRRSALQKAGEFPTQYGSGGDFFWGMMAGLHCNVIHVPRFLATWRIHGNQASAVYRETPEERALMLKMVNDALDRYEVEHATPRLPRGPLTFPYRYDLYRLKYSGALTPTARLRLLAELLTQPALALRMLRLVLTGRRRSFDRAQYLKELIRDLGLTDRLESLAEMPVPNNP